MSSKTNLAVLLFKYNGLLKSLDEMNKDEKSSGEEPMKFEGYLLAALQSLTSVFDAVDMLRAIGIIRPTNTLYKRIQRNSLDSKVRLVTSLLLIRKTLGQLLKLVRIRHDLTAESSSISNAVSSDSFTEKIQAKFEESLKAINQKIRLVIIDLVDLILYLAFIAVDLCRFKIVKRYERALQLILSVFYAVKPFKALSEFTQKT
ncbi:HCL677Cp [Eremothecium sinecaudum]|uniref:HCL677Cp n=1 Tax=Eremothecium sinecaudum TaxID=45286 RepID=A0A120K1J8_9SACH|nr:HCL677Cp [Eremothecium sinecaudum]AMD19474.1 HCL677Cp [Eremothecium sinecaudum]